MKYVLTLTILGFIVLSCKKSADTSTTSASDTTIVADSTIAPVPADTISVDSTATNRTDTADTTKVTK
ncbi:hypothetical protein SAMN05421841_1352 [Chryseobacterium wanjuense]|uniref:Uncharacterized protein n=1 Tax=Chryseobacterium wanjuense TaxID=356305 RepID=A0A1I0PQR5_9FLAO|nr:hypothetical protein SAMN05421841_1352 [Chryseobacterium wanjuense]